MKAENCAEITDAKRIELKSGLAEPGNMTGMPDSSFLPVS